MDISWTWLGIAVLALIAAACIMGFRKGFVKEIVSVFFMLISFLLVWAVNPYVNTFVKEYTPVYDTIQDKAQAATPVPGGVGAVTTAVLAKHLVRAAGL